MRISELTLVAPDKETRDSIPQNERSYAGIRCRGIEEREPRIQDSNYASNHLSSRNGQTLG